MDDVPFDSQFDPLAVRGSVDELEITTFREALREATRDYTTSVVVDLNGVTFLPSIAIGTLLGAMARAPGTRVQVDDDKPAHHVLKLLGLDEYARTGRAADGSNA
jgi:anti-anti-sigma factor